MTSPPGRPLFPRVDPDHCDTEREAGPGSAARAEPASRRPCLFTIIKVKKVGGCKQAIINRGGGVYCIEFISYRNTCNINHAFFTYITKEEGVAVVERVEPQ
jgi:hypothetical protein